MKKLLVLTLFIFTTSLCFSQYYYSGYVDGFKKACSCNKSIPSNNITNKYGSYNDGYNAGYTDGRIYINNNNNSNYDKKPTNYDTQNMYKPDFELMEKALRYKQEQYDEQIRKQQNQIEDQERIKEEKTKASIEQIKSYYDHVISYPEKIKDGWHKVWVTNNKNFCDERKVLVENNNIVKYLVNDKSFRPITSTLPISAGKTICRLSTPDLLDVYFLETISNPDSFTLGPNSIGRAMFWINSSDRGTIHLTIDGVNFGDFINYFEVEPSCGQNGTIMLEAVPGEYTYKATSNNYYWEGTIRISENSCTVLKINTKTDNSKSPEKEKNNLKSKTNKVNEKVNYKIIGNTKYYNKIISNFEKKGSYPVADDMHRNVVICFKVDKNKDEFECIQGKARVDNGKIVSIFLGLSDGTFELFDEKFYNQNNEAPTIQNGISQFIFSNDKRFKIIFIDKLKP
jgi:hypothetical protein